MSGAIPADGPTPEEGPHPCLTCGACCAAYRVSFYWAEADRLGLPETLTEKLNPWLSCMAGTNRAHPYCMGLEGQVGQRVACGIYDRRPSPCREVQPGDDQCRRARARWGLPELPIP